MGRRPHPSESGLGVGVDADLDRRETGDLDVALGRSDPQALARARLLPTMLEVHANHQLVTLDCHLDVFHLVSPVVWGATSSRPFNASSPSHVNGYGQEGLGCCYRFALKGSCWCYPDSQTLRLFSLCCCS
jgi:hypothetical protein